VGPLSLKPQCCTGRGLPLGFIVSRSGISGCVWQYTTEMAQLKIISSDIIEEELSLLQTFFYFFSKFTPKFGS
jgi:hypothetical protein